jgi:hypothetical protein
MSFRTPRDLNPLTLLQRLDHARENLIDKNLPTSQWKLELFCDHGDEISPWSWPRGNVMKINGSVAVYRIM